MKFTSYIWDFDGTLLDTYPHISAAFEEIMDRAGIAYNHEDVLDSLYISFSAWRDKYGLTEEQYAAALALEESFAKKPLPVPFSGTAAVLRAICEAGGQNFICTHRNRSTWTYLRVWGLDKYFKGGVDGTMGFPYKPCPDSVEHICRIYGIDKSAAVMVGDRGIDVAAGVNAGCTGCLFMSHPLMDDASSATYTVRSMRELAEAFEIPLKDNDMLGEKFAASIRTDSVKAAAELCDAAHLKIGDIVVVGCSSSEITGKRIGSLSSPEAAQAVLDGLLEVFSPRGIHIAAQCCEHLNRALIVEKKVVQERGYDTVNVIPVPKAGGAFATAAWQKFDEPVAIEEIKADAGLDIGNTLIGMHLKRVAVPLRLSIKSIGHAPLTAARVRPPFAGGERAVYNHDLM